MKSNFKSHYWCLKTNPIVVKTSAKLYKVFVTTLTSSHVLSICQSYVDAGPVCIRVSCTMIYL